MNLQTLATNYAAYHLWANQQLVNWLSTKPAEQLTREVPSSFSSILKTLNHIWAVDEYWYAVITKTKDFENRYGLTELNAEEVFEGLINRSTKIANQVKIFTDADLEETIKVESPWLKTIQPRIEYIQQLANHGTYHRGQIVTISRNVGLTDAPNTDYIFYTVIKEQQ